MSEAQVRHIARVVIPKKIAATALRLRLESEVIRGERTLVVCTKCGQAKPAHTLYFARSREKKTGFCSHCKECQKKTRDAKKQREAAKNE